MVGRKPKRDTSRFDALLEGRDHLRIQLHLAGEKGTIDPETLKTLQAQLGELEKKIEEHWKAAASFSTPRV